MHKEKLSSGYSEDPHKSEAFHKALSVIASQKLYDWPSTAYKASIVQNGENLC